MSERIEGLLRLEDSDSLEQAIALLKHTDVHQHASSMWIITPSLVEKGRIDLVRMAEVNLREKIEALPEPPHNNYPWFELAHSQMVSADSEGLVNSLKTAKGDGWETLKSDLGLNDEQMSAVLIWAANLPKSSAKFSASELLELLNGSYHKPIEHSNELDSSRTYRELVRCRLLAFGEEGLRFPPHERLGVSQTFSLAMGAEFALRRNTDEVKRWLSRLNGVPSGKSYARHVIDQL